MTDFLKIAKSIVVHFAHICAYGIETVKHHFLADSLQLIYLTSRLGGAESFATSISFEKLDRSCSPSCPYFWRQFSAILAASQPCFVDIPLIRSNIKGGTKHFSSENTPRSS